MAHRLHLVGIDVEDGVVMGGLVAELRLHEVGKLVAVRLARLPRHADAAEGVDAPLQGRVRLQADDELVFPIDIPRGIGQEGRDAAGVDIEHAALFAFGTQKRLHLGEHGAGARRGRAQKVRSPLVRGVVFLNEAAHVDRASIAGVKLVLHLSSSKN